MADQNLNVNIRGRDNLTDALQRVENRLKQLENRLGNVDDKAERVTRTLKNQKDTANALTGQLKRLGGVLAGVFAARTLNNAIQLGAQISTIRSQFERITISQGQDPAEVLNRLRDAARDTASDFELLKAATDGFARGLDLPTVLDAAGAAFTVAQQRGISFAQALDLVNTALVSMSVEVLDSIGVTREQLEGADSYAAKLGIVRNQLRQLANESTENAGTAVQQLGAIFNNFQERISEGLVNNEEFQEFVNKIDDFFETEKIDAWTSTIINALNSITGFIDDHPTLSVLLGGAALGTGFVGRGFLQGLGFGAGAGLSGVGGVFSLKEMRTFLSALRTGQVGPISTNATGLGRLDFALNATRTGRFFRPAVNNPLTRGLLRGSRFLGPLGFPLEAILGANTLDDGNFSATQDLVLSSRFGDGVAELVAASLPGFNPRLGPGQLTPEQRAAADAFKSGQFSNSFGPSGPFLGSSERERLLREELGLLPIRRAESRGFLAGGTGPISALPLSGVPVDAIGQGVTDFTESSDFLNDRFTLLGDSVGAVIEGMDDFEFSLREFGQILGRSLTSQGSQAIVGGLNAAVDTSGVGNFLTKNLGSLGGALALGGGFLALGGLFSNVIGGSDAKKLAEDNHEALQSIKRNTAASVELLNRVINAPANFINPLVGQVQYQTAGTQAFLDFNG